MVNKKGAMHATADPECSVRSINYIFSSCQLISARVYMQTRPAGYLVSYDIPVRQWPFGTRPQQNALFYPVSYYSLRSVV